MEQREPCIRLKEKSVHSNNILLYMEGSLPRHLKTSNGKDLYLDWAARKKVNIKIIIVINRYIIYHFVCLFCRDLVEQFFFFFSKYHVGQSPVVNTMLDCIYSTSWIHSLTVWCNAFWYFFRLFDGFPSSSTKSWFQSIQPLCSSKIFYSIWKEKCNAIKLPLYNTITHLKESLSTH